MLGSSGPSLHLWMRKQSLEPWRISPKSCGSWGLWAPRFFQPTSHPPLCLPDTWNVPSSPFIQILSILWDPSVCCAIVYFSQPCLGAQQTLLICNAPPSTRLPPPVLWGYVSSPPITAPCPGLRRRTGHTGGGQWRLGDWRPADRFSQPGKVAGWPWSHLPLSLTCS